MQSGGPQPERDIAKLVEYLRQTRDPRRDPDKLQETLYAFLKKHKAADPATLDLTEIVELVSQPAAPSLLDALMEGTGLVLSVFERVRNPARCVELCQSPEEVHEAVRWMFIELGRLMTRKQLTAGESIYRGEDRIGTSLADYQRRAVEWWRAEPWTVIRVRGHRRSAGMSIVLPLKADIYESVFRGERKTYWCTPADLCRPSPNLLVEGLTMRPAEEGLEGDAPSLNLIVAVLCQEAHLSDVPGVGIEFPLRLLTFAAAPKQRQRALKFEYKPTGTYMHGTDVEFLERQLIMKNRGIRQWGLWGIWRGLQKSTADAAGRCGEPAFQPRS